MQAQGHSLKGIRLDSGDLAYLTKKSRKMLDDANLNDVKIAVSNQLDEYVIKSLLEQQAPIDVFGVGTNLVTGSPDAALDGVYKLAYTNGKPRIKLSENIDKTTLPHRKQVYRILATDGHWIGADAITLREENEVKNIHHPFDPHKSTCIETCEKEPLLEKVMEGGKRVGPQRSLNDIATYSQERLAMLQEEYKRFENPHIYKVGISDKLMKQRNDLIVAHKKQ